ncbi:MAG TPA: hypothetical protein DEF45_04530 [Rhodopirellula sp.]|nr:MAG: hypothetical protein CBD74_07710 [Saprospirales bacterium TMED214]HBV62270.1 hypothetical protein [Rhodopirellula sp.]
MCSINKILMITQEESEKTVFHGVAHPFLSLINIYQTVFCPLECQQNTSSRCPRSYEEERLPPQTQAVESISSFKR